MRMMKRMLALLLALLTLGMVPAMAEVQRSDLLDAALSMLEEGNVFLERYNEITGANIQARFELGLPYFFGGKHDDMINGEARVFAREPLYTKREIWEQTRFYDKNQYYLYGFDCSGFTQWVYSEVGYPEHPPLDEMINQWGKYQNKNHVYSHRKGKEMPSFDQLAANLQVGDLLVGKNRARHVMMFIGTLRDFGFTEEELPELAPYLDYALVIHCGPNLMYGPRMQTFLDAHADDSYYDGVKTPDGGVAVSLIGVPFEDAPHQEHVDITDFAWFEMPDGYKLTIWDLPACTSFCWFRINGI
ncbi:MAG: C40 family peptidase [Clostridia bacterium]|nr:C40 family peptidase [Clostridia bacterium]